MSQCSLRSAGTSLRCRGGDQGTEAVKDVNEAAAHLRGCVGTQSLILLNGMADDLAKVFERHQAAQAGPPRIVLFGPDGRVHEQADAAVAVMMFVMA